MNKIFRDAFRYAGMSVKKLIVQPVNLVKRMFIKITSLKIIITTIMAWVRDGIKNLLGGKTESLEDYVRFQRYYIAKRLVFVVTLALIVISVVYIQFLHPHVSGFFVKHIAPTPVFDINSPKMAVYTGRAKLKYTNGVIIYEGQLKEGRVNGEGALYDSYGRIMYRGAFVIDAYSGAGEQFYPETGYTKYKGDFLYNKYEGRGALYNEDGTLLYQGGFVNNLFDGTGEMYYPNGSLKYRGEFSLGAFNGKGILYDEQANILYNGSFSNGRKNGFGELYENGIIKYVGNFADDFYNGLGKEYDSNGVLIYDGEFSNGIYDGYGKFFNSEGILYDGFTSMGNFNGKGKLYEGDFLVYDGDYRDGLKSGLGALYTEGILVYNGEFFNDTYSGEGTLYNTENNIIIYKGMFKDGMYNGEGSLFDSQEGFLIYRGGFVDGNFDGVGKLYGEEEKLLYEGEFSKGKYNGAGIAYDEDGYVIYDGAFRDGLYEGSGKLFEKEILLYEGEFLKGLYNGEGKLFNIATGFPVFEGKFLNGEFMPNGVEFDEAGKPVVEEEEEEEFVPLASESYLRMKYKDVMMYLTDNAIPYQEKSVDGGHFITIEKRFLLVLGVDMDNNPVAVRSVFICDNTGFAGVYPGMKISEATEPLGDGVEISDIIITQQLHTALTLSNTHSLNLVDKLELNAVQFLVDSKLYMTVYYYEVPLPMPEEPLTEEMPEQTPDSPGELSEESVQEAIPEKDQEPPVEKYVLFIEIR